MLIIRAEEPKRPVSKGKSGSLTGRLKEKKPKKPASEKTTRLRIIFSSLNIKYRERKINIKGSIIFIVLNTIGII